MVKAIDFLKAHLAFCWSSKNLAILSAMVLHQAQKEEVRHWVQPAKVFP
uniref:Uncharacterized protein n=1 Tax=Parascaris univalens TaxID=6257 RepID=A0A915CCN5_PARUN